MQQVQTIRRDTIKTITFRGKLLEADDSALVTIDGGMDTIGSYIDDFNHKHFVVVSGGDTFAIQMHLPKKIDVEQLNSDIEYLRMIERIEGVKPCDSKFLSFSDNRPAKEVISHIPKSAKQVLEDHINDIPFSEMLFFFMLPFSIIMFIKASLATIEMCGKIKAIWRS